MDKNITHGEKIRLVRKESGLNQSEFAEKLGVKQSYLSELESGKRDITAKVIDSLKTNFNISSDWLLSDSSELDFPINYDADITDSYKFSKLIDANREFVKGYYNDLMPSNYEYKMIMFYEDESIHRLQILKKLELDAFRESYENNKKLIEVLHSLDLKRNYLLEKFKLAPDFDVYLKEIEDEQKENMEEISYPVDKKLKTILDIICYKEYKAHWDDMLTKLISYLYQDRKWLKMDLKKQQ